MTDESALALGAGPEPVVTEAPKGEDQGQVETPPAEGQPEEKSESAKRREREKAYKDRLKQEAAEAKADAEKEKARKQALLDAAKQVAPPQESDFPDPIEYAAAKAIWGAEQRLTEREVKNAGEAVKAAEGRAEDISKREREVLVNAWMNTREEAKTRYADFETVALRGWEPSPVITDLILTSDVGADVAYHLGQNHALAAQIAAMNPVEAARAIGRIEAGIVQPKPRTETKAPDPISPVRGSAGAARDPEKMPYRDFMKFRENGGTIT
jgi:hypothetical protein